MIKNSIESPLKKKKIELNNFEELLELDRLESLFKNLEDIDKYLIKESKKLDIFFLSDEFWILEKRIEIIFGKNLEELFKEYKKDCFPNDIKCKIFKLFEKLFDFYKTKKEEFKNLIFSFYYKLNKNGEIENSLEVKNATENLKISLEDLFKKIKERIEKSLEGNEREFLIEKYKNYFEGNKEIAKERGIVFYRLIDFLKVLKAGILLENELNKGSKVKQVNSRITELLTGLNIFKYGAIKDKEIVKQLVETEKNKIPEIFKILTERKYNSEDDVIEFEVLKGIREVILYFNEYKQKIENKYKQNKETNPEMLQKEEMNVENSEINSFVGENETIGSEYDGDEAFGTPKGSTESLKSVQSKAD
uniref:Uncharacterized protein n=2 Tax=Meloidogyne TaxID=189290 RepID=A0A6V7WEE8_MELEN|nr:unnamed protein product [Meloidogyne enterolobii]